MLEFIRKENTRLDFGRNFDYFIDKNWRRNYFINNDDAEKCLKITRAFSKAYKRNIGFGDEPLGQLFYVPEFINSEFCTDLLDVLVKGLYILPTHTISWLKNGKEIGTNFISTEVYESDKLPFYYILNTGWSRYGFPYLLVNKETGSLLEMYIADILPSNEINHIYGRFDELENHESDYYQLIFTISNDGKEILNKEYTVTPLNSLITIPNQINESAWICYTSPINPEGTNIEHTVQALTDREDILFRNRIIDLIEQDRQTNKFDLPF